MAYGGASTILRKDGATDVGELASCFYDGFREATKRGSLDCFKNPVGLLTVSAFDGHQSRLIILSWEAPTILIEEVHRVGGCVAIPWMLKELSEGSSSSLAIILDHLRGVDLKSNTAERDEALRNGRACPFDAKAPV